MVGEILAYQRDLPKAEVHVLEAGIYDKPDEVATLVREFLRRTLGAGISANWPPLPDMQPQ